MKPLLPLFAALFANCAYAQQTLSCVTNGAVNTPLRAEGIAEMVGDLLVTCTGGTSTPLGSPVPTVTIDVFVNTSITSKLLAGTWSEALLLVDEPVPAAQRICGTARRCGTEPWAVLA